MIKSIILFLAFCVILSIQISAQSEPNNRLVLIEESSADNCGPCATAAVTIRNVLKLVGVEKAVMVRYGAWTSDDYYINNPQDNAGRVAYYGNTTVPKVWVDGQNEMVGTIQIANNLHSILNSRSSVTSPLEIKCSLNLSNFTITAKVKTIAPVPAANYFLRVAIVETEHVWSSPPGTNGQTTFDYCLLDMVPSFTGTSVNLILGDSVYLTTEYDPDAIDFHNYSNLAVIAFVQNDLTKEILQTGYSEYVPPVGIAPRNMSRNNKQILLSNYPNPFNPSTTINYWLPAFIGLQQTKLVIYNLLGQEVKTLVNCRQSSGFQTIQWDGRDGKGNQVSGGTYLYRITSGNLQTSRKMILNR